MKEIVWKPFWDYEKEETWLNAMAARGLSMCGYSWCRYVFDRTEPGRYLYRIELLGHPPDHPESCAYIEFVEETGAEMVASYLRWVYFRRKTGEGAFDMHSDLESRIDHYVKVRRFWDTFTLLECAVGLGNVIDGAVRWVSDGGFSPNLAFGIPLLVFGCFFLYLGSKLRRKITRLRKERVVRE